jgi:hypothetical protein
VVKTLPLETHEIPEPRLAGLLLELTMIAYEIATVLFNIQ